LAANTEEKQPASSFDEAAGKTYLKGDARMKRRSLQFSLMAFVQNLQLDYPFY